MLKKAMSGKQGATLIIVMIVAVVLFAIGAAVMLFSSSNLTSSNKKIEHQQTYYIAKSAMNTLDYSIKSSGTGEYIRDEVLNDYISNGGGAASRSKNWELAPTITFDKSELDGYTATVKISFTSTSNSSSVAINDMIVTMTLSDGRNDSYKVTAKYSYSGIYEKTGSTYNWTQNNWTLVSVSQ